jgi:hypothetical protein
MAAMQRLVRVPEIAKVAQAMGQEMMKVSRSGIVALVHAFLILIVLVLVTDVTGGSDR